ncbi:MAG: hypothetical protein LBL48_03760 [Azoarcus sp.]|jgi:hypothetical protein|nr:hypothetical protein [Azoarcus sp.]
MTRGRKPLPPARFQEEVTEAQIAEAIEAIDNAPPTPKDFMDVFEFGGSLRAAQAFEMIEKFSRAAKIRAFDGARKSKGYKHLKIKRADGIYAVAENFAEFCRLALGQSYQSLAEESAMLESLGESLYEIVKQLGISRSSVRLLVALPEDERESVQHAIAAADKSEVASIIHDLVDKLEKERAAAAEARAEKQAAEVVSARNRERANAAEAEVEKLKAAPTALPDAALEADVRNALLIGAHGKIHTAYQASLAGLADLRETIEQYFDLAPGPADGPRDARALIDALVEKVGEGFEEMENAFRARKVAAAAANGEKQEWEIWAEEQDAADAAAAARDHGDDD